MTTLVVLVLIILGAAVFALYWYLPKAEVVLLIEPKVLEEEFEVKLNSTLVAVDKDELILPAQEVTVTLEESETRTTTGTKLTGEKAKGEVTVFNGTSEEKTFEAVIALDVLEHIDNFQYSCDQLYNMTSKYIIICLPNMSNIRYRLNFLFRGEISSKYRLVYHKNMEQYNDRHRWVTNLKDCNQFFLSFSSQKNMTLSIDSDPESLDKFIELLRPYGIKELIRSGRVSLLKG